MILRETFIRFVLVFVSVLSIVVCAELIFRAAQLAPRVYRLDPKTDYGAFQLSENPILGYELRAGFRGSPNSSRIFSYINADGQRDKERKITKQAQVKRVIILGDSVVAGQGLADLNDTISRRLEDRFGGQNVEVLNFGVSGYCTRGEVELLKIKGLKYQPDVVVIIFVENDFIESNGELIREVGFERPNYAKQLFSNSHFFRAISLRTNLFRFRDEFGFGDRYVTNAIAIGKNNVHEGLKEFRLLSEKHGFRPLIVAWPSFSDDQIYYSKHEYSASNPSRLRIEDIASENGLSVFRLDSYFQQNFAEGALEKGRGHSPRWTYTNGDGMHPSKYGAKIAADGLRVPIENLLSQISSPSPAE